MTVTTFSVSHQAIERARNATEGLVNDSREFAAEMTAQEYAAYVLLCASMLMKFHEGLVTTTNPRRFTLDLTEGLLSALDQLGFKMVQADDVEEAVNTSGGDA